MQSRRRQKEALGTALRNSRTTVKSRITRNKRTIHLSYRVVGINGCRVNRYACCLGRGTILRDSSGKKRLVVNAGKDAANETASYRTHSSNIIQRSFNVDGQLRMLLCETSLFVGL